MNTAAAMNTGGSILPGARPPGHFQYSPLASFVSNHLANAVAQRRHTPTGNGSASTASDHTVAPHNAATARPDGSVARCTARPFPVRAV
jgi:hypothetical protein